MTLKNSHNYKATAGVESRMILLGPTRSLGPSKPCMPISSSASNPQQMKQNKSVLRSHHWSSFSKAFSKWHRQHLESSILIFAFLASEGLLDEPLEVGLGEPSIAVRGDGTVPARSCVVEEADMGRLLHSPVTPNSAAVETRGDDATEFGPLGEDVGEDVGVMILAGFKRVGDRDDMFSVLAGAAFWEFTP